MNTPHPNLVRLLDSALSRNDRRTLALAAALAKNDRRIILAGIRSAGKGKGPGWLVDAVETLRGAGDGWEWAYITLYQEAMLYSCQCFTQEQANRLYTI